MQRAHTENRLMTQLG